MAATMGGDPSAAPMPVRPLSVYTRISVESLFSLVPRSVRWRFSFGTGADMGVADTLVIFTTWPFFDGITLRLQQSQMPPQRRRYASDTTRRRRTASRTA